MENLIIQSAHFFQQRFKFGTMWISDIYLIFRFCSATRYTCVEKRGNKTLQLKRAEG